MARQIAYDPVALRQDLLSVFWANGYAETSLADLEAATGLNRRQLYNGPGDKKSMFLQALDDFSDVAGKQFLAPLEQESAGLADIRALLGHFVELAKSGDGPGGCMVCSTSQEDIAADGDVKRRIDSYFGRIQGAYRNALVQAAARREVRLSPQEIEQKSRLLFGMHVALCVLARAKLPFEELEKLAAAACAVVD